MNGISLRFSSIVAGFFTVLISCPTQGADESARKNQPVKTDSLEKRQLKLPSLLREARNKHFALPWLTEKNIDQYIAEINERVVTRISLARLDDSRGQPEMLRKFHSACPQLTAISISDWNFSLKELHELIDNLPGLSRLELSSCRITTGDADNASDIDLIEPKMGLTSLSVHGCRGVDNEMMAKLLAAMPELKELSLRDSEWTGEVFDGRDWPLSKLTNLRRFSISAAVDDAFICRLLDEVPGLESLQLWDCQKVTGKGWTFAPSNGIAEFALIRCENVSDECVSAILRQTSGLKTLRIHSYEGIDGEGLDLTPLTKLRHLEFRGHRWNGDFLARALKSLKNLESLDGFSAHPVKEQEFDFSLLTKLKTLSISSCGVPPEGFATLPSSLQSLQIQCCWVTNSSIAAMLPRLPNLQTLKLVSINGGRGYETDPDAITGAGWNFTAQKKLSQLDLGDCNYITDDLVARIAAQLPSLESLRFRNSRNLTGENWDLQRLSNLKFLEMDELPRLDNDIVGNLPSSLESLRVINCSRMTGQEWDLTTLPQLTSLEIQRCRSLLSLGPRLPSSLRNLRVYECTQLQANELDYSGIENLETLSFHECHRLDTDRLFAALPEHALSLSKLDLTGCPDLTSNEWDLSPLKHTLHEIIYPEGESSYVGGIDEVKCQILKQQLPDTKIKRD